MGWHQSKSDPRKVYDSYHGVVCVCQNAEQAQIIISAVNQAARGEENARDSQSAGVSEHAQAEAPAESRVDVIDEDDCCSKRLTRALRIGKGASAAWICPGCGCEWRSHDEGEAIRRWSPEVTVAIFRK